MKSNEHKFAKLRAILTCVPMWSTCQSACVPAWFTCQRACLSTCQKRANFSFLRVNVPTNVPTSHVTCHLHANVPNGVPIFRFGVPTCQKACQFFRHSFYEILREVSTLSLLYKKFYIILHIIVIHIICIVHKNCIKLNFYTSCHIKQKCVEFFFFIIFLLYSLVRHEI